MVFKSASVLSCLLPARLGFGANHKPDPPRDQEKYAKDHHHPARLLPHAHLGEPPLAVYQGTGSLDLYTHPPNLPRARPNTAPSDSSAPLIPDGGIGESPNPALVRQKRSSFTTFFAFSSKRKSTHGSPIIHLPRLQPDLLAPPHAVPGRWVSDSGRTEVHLINPSSVPSPLRSDEEEYYYSYYTSVTPTFPSSSPHPDVTRTSPSKRLSVPQQDFIGSQDLDSQLSSPVDSHPSHTLHPYSYSTPLDSTSPSLRHSSSQPFQHHPHSRSEINARHARNGTSLSHVGQEASQSGTHLLQPQTLTSVSTPNLASGAAPVRLRSFIKKKPPARSKGQERWLSAETWWDALLSPSPRFKVKQAPRPHTATGMNTHDAVDKPVEGELDRNMVTTLPSVRPRAVSATSNVRPTPRVLTRSRSAADLLRRPSTSGTPRVGFEPALETLVDDPISTPDQVPGRYPSPPLPDSSLSLEHVIDEREAFAQQRAQWKQQAAKSLGNKHTRSISRARSRSFGEKHVQGHHGSEGNKTNFEFLATRTLLGSQSTKPTVHVTKPSISSSQSKAYSHSHSHSAHSYTSHSHAYSHSHSHSLTTSNSSKSSRNLLRGHSRNESWSTTALLKAGALCGIDQDESYDASADAKLPSSSRAGVQGVIRPSDATNAEASETVNVSPAPSVPSGEVGIAITLSPAESNFDRNLAGPSGSQRREGDHESRWSSFDYAGPHPSVVDSNLPQHDVASNVSLRHRLPPRAAIHPPIPPMTHPYRSALAQPEQAGGKEGEGATLKVPEGQDTVERSPYPHVSLSNADFDRYGVGEALVFASMPRTEEVLEAERASESRSSPAIKLPPPEEQSRSCETVVLRPEDPEASSSVANSPPSLTNSTIQMVMSAFDNPDDFDEFQDLFYKPHSASRDQRQTPSLTISQVPTDIHNSASSSPLTHLMRKLSEEVHGHQDSSRTPSDPIRLQRNEPEGHHLNESGTKFVFTDLTRSSSSPPPMESSSQTHLPIRKESEPSTQPVMVVPEDVNSSYTASVLESPLEEEQENDTFGYPIKRGEFEAVAAPTPVQSPIRVSTHLSIQQEEGEEEDNGLLSPMTKRSALSSADAARSSYLTTSDLSHMSRLSDFPLPPGMTPSGPSGHLSSLLRAYATQPALQLSEQRQHEDAAGNGQEGRHTDDRGDEETSGDVEETLRILRMSPRVTSYESHRTTFGGSDDMDFIAQSPHPTP